MHGVTTQRGRQNTRAHPSKARFTNATLRVDMAGKPVKTRHFALPASRPQQPSHRLIQPLQQAGRAVSVGNILVRMDIDLGTLNALTGLMSAQAAQKPKPKCLFIGPMKGADSATRDRFEVLYEDLVDPAAKAVGMEPQSCRADSPGMITPNIFKMIRHAQVIVADMTGDNTCVGYELAFAHSLARCTVLIIKEGHKIPFDLRDMYHIKFDHEDDASMRAARGELKEHLRSYSRMGWVSANNPIFHAAYAPPEDAKIHETLNLFASGLASIPKLGS